MQIIVKKYFKRGFLWYYSIYMFCVRENKSKGDKFWQKTTMIK